MIKNDENSVDRIGGERPVTLHFYGSLGHVRAVRQHLAWPPNNLLLRFATRSDVWADKAWQAGLACVRDHDLRCEIEIFSSQLPELKVLSNTGTFPACFVGIYLAFDLKHCSRSRSQFRRSLFQISSLDSPREWIEILAIYKTFHYNVIG